VGFPCFSPHALFRPPLWSGFSYLATFFSLFNVTANPLLGLCVKISWLLGVFSLVAAWCVFSRFVFSPNFPAQHSYLGTWGFSGFLVAVPVPSPEPGLEPRCLILPPYPLQHTLRLSDDPFDFCVCARISHCPLGPLHVSFARFFFFQAPFPCRRSYKIARFGALKPFPW